MWSFFHASLIKFLVLVKRDEFEFERQRQLQTVPQSELFRCAVRLRGGSRLAKKETHHDRGRTARDPENRALLKMQVQVRRVSEAFADVLCENRAKESCNPKTRKLIPPVALPFTLSGFTSLMML